MDSHCTSPCRLEEYARRLQMPETDVWQLIHEGVLRARCYGERVYILPDDSPEELIDIPEDQSLATKLPSDPLEPSSDWQHWWEFGRRSLQQISQLHRQLIQNKERLIQLQEEKINQLEEKKQQQSNEIRQLQQNIEDLNILNRCLQHQHD